MLPLILFLLLVVVPIICSVYNRRKRNYEWSDFSIIITTALVIIVALCLIMWAGVYTTSISGVNTFEGQRDFLCSSQSGTVESVAMGHKVIEMNGWLRNIQYWNNTFLFDWFITDRVNQLQPLVLGDVFTTLPQSDI